MAVLVVLVVAEALELRVNQLVPAFSTAVPDLVAVGTAALVGRAAMAATAVTVGSRAKLFLHLGK